MKKSEKILSKSELRRRAEMVLGQKSQRTIDLSIMSRDAIEDMVHDLQVHQIELEMQNDEQRRIHNDLEKIRDNYISLYDFAPVGYFTISEKGMVEEANLSAADMVGMERRGLVGKLLTHFIRREDQDIFYRHRLQLFEKEIPKSCELRLLKKNGQEFYAILKSIVVNQGDYKQIRMAVSDVTETKLLEKALQEAHDELERRVAERTAELSEANRLLQSEIIERKRIEDELKIRTERLEQSHRDLAEFIHVATHDLQEPTRKIQTFSDLLLTGSPGLPDDATRGFLERIQHSAWRMQTLVLELLRYSRLTERPVQSERLNLRDVAQEAIIDLSMLLEETGGSVEIDALPEIEADRDQMVQLFQNLIGNGLKYRKEKKPVIRISGRSFTDQFLEIFVEDNGIGFDECYVENIFKPFQRLHGSKSPFKGPGMGLAICRRIVEGHGGVITAKSEPGKGSVFIVRLPWKVDRRGKKIE